MNAVPRRLRSLMWLTAAMCCALALSGCKGCTSNPLVKRNPKSTDIDEAEKKKKEKEKQKKDDFEFKLPQVLPGDPKETRAFVKPGHWVTVRNLVKANNFDFQAELQTGSTDSNGRLLRIEDTDFQIVSSRPAPLPKGQDKALDTTYFVPIIHNLDPLMPRSVWLSRELRASRGGRLVWPDQRQGTVPMPSYQYYFVVLAAEPDRYSFLKSIPSVAMPTTLRADAEKLVYYRVTAPAIDRIAPLPSHALTWTSIAYVWWDDVPKTAMTPLQQQAMLDWLHWGGQVIISGPNSLEKLRGTFLEPYLPAKSGNTGEVAQGSIEELNKFWSMPDKKKGDLCQLNIQPDKPLIAVQLEKHPDAQYVPHTGELLVERRVGAGRIIATAFSLSDSRLLKWKSLDNFLNGAILRRLPRDYHQVDSLPEGYWAGLDPGFSSDARLVSTLRYFSRDVGHFSSSPDSSTAPGWEPGEAPLADDLEIAMNAQRRAAFPVRTDGKPLEDRPLPPKQITENLGDDWHFRGLPFRRNTGMAAWNDRSGPSDSAREALKDAAGISVPRGEFVFRVLAVYLAVLAPLNWFVFRAMGRVEWAWIAAPMIAIVGTFAVVRMAQLDIGFARSTTEISIAEMHGGYPRAHVTRYIALYTSLSTSYDLEFADDGALAQPFSSSVEGVQRPTLRTTLHTVSLRRDKQLKLSGFLVPSNTTGYVHCEQLNDLGGVFTLVGDDASGYRLQNGTPISLHGAGVVRKTSGGELETVWLGDVRPKTTVPLRFTRSESKLPHFPQWDEAFVTLSYNAQAQTLLNKLDRDKDGIVSRNEARQDTALSDEFPRFDHNHDGKWEKKELTIWCRQSRAGELSLGQQFELATKALRLAPGEMRLIGWSDDLISGTVIRPAAAQYAGRTMFLVHLIAGDLPEPQSDVRRLSDVMEIKPENELETPEPPEVP